MKQILLFTLAILCLFTANSQVTLLDPIELVSGDPSVADDDVIEVHWDVQNTGSETLKLRVHRDVLSAQAGTRDRFCWGALCYDWGTEESSTLPNLINELVPDEIDATFIGDYEHNGNLGSSVFRYTFFDHELAGVYASFEVTYCVQDDPSNCAVSVKELEVTNFLGNIAPNPINDQGTLLYQINELKVDAKLVVYNMIGDIMIQQKLDRPSGELNLSFDELPNGVYFYAIINGGQSIATKKLVVSK